MSTITDLIPRLYNKTLERKLLWESAEDNGIWIRIGDSLVEVSYRGAMYESPTYAVRIRNAQGKIVDQELLSDEDPRFEQVGAMFATARRAALKVDETLDAILSQLEKL